MKTYQFTVASMVDAPGSDWDGHYVETPGLLTPPVTTETPTAAIHHPETVAFCREHNCTVYEVKR